MLSLCWVVQQCVCPALHIFVLSAVWKWSWKANKMQQLTLNLALQPTSCLRVSESLRPADSTGGVRVGCTKSIKKKTTTQKDLSCIRERAFDIFYSVITTHAVVVSRLQSTTCSWTEWHCRLQSAWRLTGPTQRTYTLSDRFNVTLEPHTDHVASVSFMTASLFLPIFISVCFVANSGIKQKVTIGGPDWLQSHNVKCKSNHQNLQHAWCQCNAKVIVICY